MKTINQVYSESSRITSADFFNNLRQSAICDVRELEIKKDELCKQEPNPIQQHNLTKIIGIITYIVEKFELTEEDVVNERV